MQSCRPSASECTWSGRPNTGRVGRREEEEQGKGRQFLLLCLTEQESAGTGVKGAQTTAQGVVAEPASEPEP